MATDKSGKPLTVPLHSDPVPAGWLTPRRKWIIAGLAVIGAGLALNWGWLTAMGAAPILLAILPCAVMCALGMCMSGSQKKP